MEFHLASLPQFQLPSCVCTYTQAEVVCCYFPYDVGHQDLDIASSCVFRSIFLCQLHAHIKNVLFFCCFLRNTLFTHDDVRKVTGLYLSTSFHVCQCCC